MMADLYACPYCRAEVICRDIADFRCPQCGFSGGSQLSLFHSGGLIEKTGVFDPVQNAIDAHLYHLERGQ